jgi:hypothetical protein
MIGALFASANPSEQVKELRSSILIGGIISFQMIS